MDFPQGFSVVWCVRGGGYNYAPGWYAGAGRRTCQWLEVWKMNGWNLQITHLERNMIWTKPPFFVFHVNLRGCRGLVHSLEGHEWKFQIPVTIDIWSTLGISKNALVNWEWSNCFDSTGMRHHSYIDRIATIDTIDYNDINEANSSHRCLGKNSEECIWVFPKIEVPQNGWWK